MKHSMFQSPRRYVYLSLLPCFGLALVGTNLAIAEGDETKSRGHHGPVTIADMQARMNQRFSEIDLDDNETLTLEEFTAGEPKQSGKRGKRGRFHGDHAMARDRSTPEAKEAREAALFQAMDTDGNGELSATEASRENRRAMSRELMQQERFGRLDSNGDGTLDRTEFSAPIERLVAADTDGDGELTRDEMRARRATHRAASNDS